MIYSRPTEDIINLTDGYIRDLLLTELCKRLDIVKYFNESDILAFNLEQEEGDEYISDCPLCLEHKSLRLNRRTGKCSCDRCQLGRDFLKLIEEELCCGLEAALSYVTGCIKAQEKNDSPRYTPGGEE